MINIRSGADRVFQTNKAVLRQVFLHYFENITHGLPVNELLRFACDYHICPQLLSRQELAIIARQVNEVSSPAGRYGYRVFLDSLLQISLVLFSGPEWAQFNGVDQKVELLLFCMDPSSKLFPKISSQLNRAASSAEGARSVQAKAVVPGVSLRTPLGAVAIREFL
jgi:hypothetical protein